MKQINSKTLIGQKVVDSFFSHGDRVLEKRRGGKNRTVVPAKVPVVAFTAKQQENEVCTGKEREEKTRLNIAVAFQRPERLRRCLTG